MKCFEKLQVLLHQMGIIQNDRSRRAVIFTIVLNCCILGVFVLLFISTIFCLAFEVQPTEKFLENISFTSVSVLIIFWYCNFIYQRGKYAFFFIDIDRIISKRIQNPLSNIIYQETNVKVEYLTKCMHIIWTYVLFSAFSIPLIIKSIYNYSFLNHGYESFQQIYPAMYPFDWRTPLGYLGCILIQVSTISISAELLSNVLVLLIGFCWFMADFAIDIKELLLELNEDWIKATNGNIILERVDVKKRFTELIQFHSDAREYVMRFSDTNIYLVSSFLLFTLVDICCLYLQINSDLEGENIVTSLRYIMAILALISWLYVFCDFGHKVTQRFDDLNGTVFGMEWYLLPLKMQKTIPMIISMAQKEVHIQGFGNFHSTREVFMKIMKTSLSYFLVLRR